MGLLVNTSAGERGAVASYLVTCWRLLTVTLAVVWGSVCWWVRHYRYVAGVALAHTVLALMASVAAWHDRTGIPADVQVKISCAVFLLVPAVVAVVWARWWPVEFELFIAGPWRRHLWRSWARSSWGHVARESGLSVQRSASKTQLVRTRHHGKTNWAMDTQEVPVWVHPPLESVHANGEVLTLVASCRVGQTFDDLEAAVPAIGTAAGAMSWRSTCLTPSRIQMDFVMRELLTAPRKATLPAHLDTAAVLDAVAKATDPEAGADGAGSPYTMVVGRRQDGQPWVLCIEERHTFVGGASGSGKGSVLWGLIGGLAPYVPSDTVRLWGADLKHGTELKMGAGLFHRMATTPQDAVAMLADLVAVMGARGEAMAGVSRKHTAAPGDPVHVLVIDELAMLVAYSDPEIRKEASQLLKQLLTTGRSLGVLVAGFAQDPRKEVIETRALFTQKLALRLDSKTEVGMVLGTDHADLARADRIPRTMQGTGWIVDSETGTVDKVRADYWDDRTIRTLARTFPAPAQPGPVVLEAVFTPGPVDDTTTTAETDTTTAGDDARSSAGAAGFTGSTPGGRKPRKPRAPRAPRQPREHAPGSTGEAA